jgi:hypothetical protein
MMTQTDTVAFSWAKRFKGAAVILEHRYFGPSKPFGASNPAEQSEEFQYLTLDNVMDDAVAFVDSLRTNLTGGARSKVIITGCSYPGWLVTVFRQNRPNTFWGAIASGTPVEGWATSKYKGRNADYNNWLNNIYQLKSYEAWSNIRTAYDTLKDRIASGNLSTLQTEFKTCDPVTNDTAPVLFSLAGSVHGIVAQYNTKALRVNPIPFPLETALDIAMTATYPIQILSRTIWSWFSHFDIPCLNLSDPAGDVAKAVPLIEFSVWNYIICKYSLSESLALTGY